MTFVYLIEAQCGLVKIGYGYSPEQRLQNVRTHSPVLVRLLAQWPGSLHDEKSFHERFVEYRSHNEWFRIDGELLSFVAETRGRGLARIEPWGELTFVGRKAKISATRSAQALERWADPEFRRQTAMRREYRAELERVREVADMGGPPLSTDLLTQLWADVEAHFEADLSKEGDLP